MKSLLLPPLSTLYGAVTRTRLSLYRRGTFRTTALDRPVISVGNMTVGGTGKTPLVEWVAPQLQGAKQRDFALALGPVVTTPDEEVPPGVDWERLVAHAAENTSLFPGDLIVR